LHFFFLKRRVSSTRNFNIGSIFLQILVKYHRFLVFFCCFLVEFNEVQFQLLFPSYVHRFRVSFSRVSSCWLLPPHRRC